MMVLVDHYHAYAALAERMRTMEWGLPASQGPCCHGCMDTTDNIQPLTTDEAVEAILTGDHPEAAQGDVLMDVALIELLRDGTLVAARTPTGKIAFKRVK